MTDEGPRVNKAELPTPGLYTTLRRDDGNLHAVKRKSRFFHKFRVEKREGTPYRTHSYLPGGARPKNRAARRQGFPPVFLERKSVRNMLLV
jgi:hypothetical protein